MTSKRNPKRDEAFEIWKEHNGEVTNKAIAELVDAPAKTISAWKSRDKWTASLKSKECSTTSKKRSTTKKSTPKKVVEESDNLNDKQRLFCIYYIKYFNATKAYQKAYECAYTTAMTEGHRSLRNPKITSEIKRMKEEKTSGLMLDVRDVLQKYIDIAFADITDFTKFGRKEVEVYDEAGDADTIEVNYVDFIESTEVDGTIITEVKQGKDGISVKLADKMRALEMLSKYFDLLSDNDKKRLQEEKIKVEIEQITKENKQVAPPTINIVDAWSDDDE